MPTVLQRYGFNGFSFQHVADLLGIKKPSLYDHFKSKDILGQAIVQEYRESFRLWSETVESFAPHEKISGFFDLFFKFSMRGGFCPMSAFIGDYYSLSKPTIKALTKMYDEQTEWIQKVLKEGQKQKVFRRDLACKDLASVILSLSIGSQFSARVLQNAEHIQLIKVQALQFLKN